jgi:hypothetical protein
MKRLSFSIAALSALLLVSACSKEEVQAKMDEAANKAGGALESLKDIDLGSLSPDALKEKANSLTDSLATQLGEIKDKASAMDVKKAAEPVVDMLSKMKGMLGENMPDLSSLNGVVDDLKAKFNSDEGVMGVLKPLLDKLQSLVS